MSTPGFDPGAGGVRNTFQSINQKEKQQVADLKTSPVDDPDKEAAIARLESDQTVATSSVREAYKGADQDRLNIAIGAYDADGDQQLSESEFDAMSEMLLNPNMPAYEQMIHEVYQNAIGRKEGADGAGMASWAKRAIELEKQGLSPAQIKEALTIEIQNVAGVQGAPPSNPNGGVGGGPY
jgi:hypothetical protein